MSDITLSPTIEDDKPIIALPKSPRFRLGKLFADMLKRYGDALIMVYVDPFQPTGRREDPRI
jgi:hypothetical protein